MSERTRIAGDPWVARHPALTVVAALLLAVIALGIGLVVDLPAGWWGGIATT